MEKIDKNFEFSDDHELDDVLDRSYFSGEDDHDDLDEDESGFEVVFGHYRPISEL